MPEIMPYIWLGVIVLALVTEAVTMGLVSIWFIPGALVALVLSFFQLGLGWQVSAFLVLSLVALLLGRRFIQQRGKIEKTNTAALIGQTAVITEQVCNVEGRGAAKVDGKVWSARTESEGDSLEVGELVEIVDIRGVRLICRKK